MVHLKQMKYGFEIVCFVVLFSCGAKYQKEIKELEHLSTMTLNSKEVLLSVDTAEVNKWMHQLHSDFQFIHKNRDTISKEIAIALDRFYQQNKAMRLFMNSYKDMHEALEKNQEQLANLKEDLSNGAIAKDDFLKYHEVEQRFVTDLNTKINASVGGVAKALQDLDQNYSSLRDIKQEIEGIN